MTALRELIDVRHRSVRAVNLEEDLHDQQVLTGYAPGAHVIDALRRITVALQDGPRSRAWSITGPYGSGKSSFAHLLCSLLAPKAAPTQRTASKLLRAADSQLEGTLARERRRLDIDRRGVILAVVSAEREPIATAVVRALHHGAELYWSGPGRKPDLVHRLRTAVHQRPHTAEAVLAVIDELSAVAPVLVVVDELGKNLEYAADRSADGDLHLLQRLAERLSSSPTFSGGLLTLTHLAFEDYLVGSRDTRRQEWRKIHGRFDDIPFVANTAHSINLLAEALHLEASPPTLQKLEQACAAAEVGLRRTSQHVELPAEVTGSAVSTYPLHPTVASALPTLAAKLAQHDRSLVAFLTSDAPHALPRFLEREHLDQATTPFYRASELYDYFFADGAANVLSGPDGELAREIRGRMEDAGTLDELERRVLKTVGLFNLISGTARLTASAALIEEALVGPGGAPTERQGIRAILDRLSDRSLLTYRDFAGEYRVWQGSDFDTYGQVAAARERLSFESTDAGLLTIIERAYPLRPEVARRHSQQKHVLRYFEARYATAPPTAEIETIAPDADGLITYVLADRVAPRTLPATTASGEPLIVMWSPYGPEVGILALDFAAATAVLSSAGELDNDPVARREMRHRVAALQAALAERIDEAFNPHRADVRLFTGGKQTRAFSRADFSRLLSDLCDQRYPDTPVIRNEMINRRELTSQGAKARRVLLERAFTREHEPRLAIDGYGPERAMYEAVFHDTGLHRDRGHGRWEFGAPRDDTPLTKVWGRLEQLLDGATDRPLGVDAIYAELLDPPFGMKVGAIPLLLVAALQHRADDIFLYQEGSFQPLIEPAHIERLLKTPERFALKRAAMVGLRATVFEQLRTTLIADERPASHRLRNATTLAVVRPLIAFATGLPEYSRTTRRTSATAQHVCSALLAAREPDELLFTAVPDACGLQPFSLDSSSSDAQLATEFVERLRAALSELGSAYERLLAQVGDLLYAGFAVEGPRSALREDLRSRSRRLLKQVIEPKMRSFLATAADENLDDEDWLEAIAMTLAAKPPSAWSDRDTDLFEALAAERAQWFLRLELLWHEMHAAQGGGFDARRVTITAPDGQERAALVAADSQTHNLVDDVLSTALAELERRAVSRPEDALLGALAGRLLSADPSTTDEASRLDRSADHA